MIRVIRLIIEELNRPSDQGDWFAWAAAQMAHGLIGVLLVGALILFAGLDAWAAAALGGGGYVVAKELPDIHRAPSWATVRDSLRDALFVAAGAAVAAALSRSDALALGVALGLGGLGLFIGTYQRAARALAGGDGA